MSKASFSVSADRPVLTGTGDNITAALFEDASVSSTDQGKDHEDIILQVARSQSDLNRRADKDAKPAIIITDDRMLRLKAKAQGIAAVATSFVSSILSAPRRLSHPGERPITVT